MSGPLIQVYVPSRSRPDRSLTLEALAPHWKKHLYLVVPREQRRDYRRLARKHGVELLPCPEEGIADTRRWIGEHAEDKFIMFDDDLRFYCRISPSEWRLRKLNKRDTIDMIMFAWRLLDDHAHVAISHRQGNNHLPYPYIEIGRPLRVLGYRRKPFLRCEHGRVRVMEDFDVTLQLLERGYGNAIITQYSQDQIGTGAAGGCSDYRTLKLHNRAAKELAELHPGLVRVSEKTYKGKGIEKGHSRLEVTISWAKAYEQGLTQRYVGER